MSHTHPLLPTPSASQDVHQNFWDASGGWNLHPDSLLRDVVASPTSVNYLAKCLPQLSTYKAIEILTQLDSLFYPWVS